MTRMRGLAQVCRNERSFHLLRRLRAFRLLECLEVLDSKFRYSSENVSTGTYVYSRHVLVMAAVRQLLA